ncbi:hypothetical protein D3C86_1007970 [compost metagenome]
MIAQMHILPGSGKCLQMLKASGGAGHGPAGALQLGGKVAVVRGPDVLRVRRDRPGRACHQMGIGGDRGGRVDEVNVQPFGIFRPFMREHRGLPETAEAVAAEIMRQVAEKAAKRFGEARLFAAGP